MFEFVSARCAALRSKRVLRLAGSQATQRAVVVGVVLSCVLGLVQAEVTPEQLSSLTMPKGFVIELLTDEVPNARQMALSDRGTLFVGTRSKGAVYAIPSALGKSLQAGAPVTASIPLQVITIANGLTLPSGLVMQGDDLLVGAVDKILRFTEVEKHLTDSAPYQVVTDALPKKRHHGWKYLSLGPDGFLYVPVGAPCNICESTDPRFASILRLDTSNGATTIYASGIRNSVGLAWHPQTQQLWFSENGRDMLGDDIPPEEINRVTEVGQHFGYPYVHAGTLPDPEFGADADPADYQHPTASFQAHSAPLGIAFYAGEQFPGHYRNALFIAEHGSWNRSKKVGYRVSLLRTDNNTDNNSATSAQTATVEPFISGWLQGEESWGRPNDVLLAPDGSLLISDDQAGAIYRVRYQPAH